MIGRFIWSDGGLEIRPGNTKTTHRQLIARFAPTASDYAVGDFLMGETIDRDSATFLASRGTPPTQLEISRMIRFELERFGREERAKNAVRKMAGTTMYRVTDVKQRDEILRNGLVPINSTGGPRAHNPAYVDQFREPADPSTHPNNLFPIPKGYDEPEDPDAYLMDNSDKVYMFQTPQDAIEFAENYRYGEQDLWQIRVPTDLPMWHDPRLYELPSNATPSPVYVAATIPPENLRLLRTVPAKQFRYTEPPSWQMQSVNTEDTEPTGGEGYLKDPHKVLYPYLFPDGGTEMPEKVKHLLKSHVLNALEDAFEDPDNFIYFTVYGSGVSYNWDEGGDLDIQMWIDIERFQQLNEDKAAWTMDDLLAEVRRHVQMVNFPTVKDIGLSAPNNPEEETTGGMLVQYYPKPGKGTKEENLASKPYACLDLETGEWYVKPKPFDPQFYGLHFLEVMPKATDMAIQAEALLDEYERNVLNWQFWFSLYSRYRNPAYQEQYRSAQRDAIMEKAGIKNMFQGIFGGRAEAYTPEGKGIEDERDMLQKLLEVWGIFQRLKHYARAALPWDEQDLPERPDDDPSEEESEANQPNDSKNSTHGWTLARKSKWRKVAALNGLPRTSVGPHPELQQVAQSYMNDAGLPYNPPQDYARVDPQQAKAIADEYEKMQHNPNDPEVKAAYDALIRETYGQYQALKNAGYNFEFYPDHDPYPNSPHEAIQDLHQNKHLYVYPTTSGFGQEDEDSSDHPLLQDSGERWNGKPVLHNDLFRGVHDVFGHAKEGVGFRADGEENAWRQHAAMFSPAARRALTSETRGQNSWVNFGPYGQQNQNANQMDTVYADQKAGLLPDWVSSEGYGRASKWSMADRSGVPEIDALIEEFLKTPQGEWTTDETTIEHLRDPELAHGMCQMVSEQFANFAKQHGLKAYVTDTDLNELGYSITGEPHGEVLDEDGEIQRGHYNEHTVVTIVLDDPSFPYGREYYVDFTATQYGYTDHPKVFSTRKEAEAYAPPSQTKSPEHDDPGGWAGIMEKAQRLRQEGGVTLTRNGVQNIVGQVVGDNGTYDTEIWRSDPNKQTISLWSCTCPWGGVSWGRTRQWKKFEGRPCAHTLALYWQAITQPLDEEYGQDQQLQIPGLDPYAGQPAAPTQQSPIDLNQALQQTVTPPTMPAPTMPQPTMPQSQPITPSQGEQMSIAFPGALSKWRRTSAALVNGDYARINKSMIGFDDRGTQYTVPRNSIVEIIWSDPEETIAIFSLGSGPLGPHNARITGPTASFSWVPRTRGTAPRRR